jgi:hypothetical protein
VNAAADTAPITVTLPDAETGYDIPVQRTSPGALDSPPYRQAEPAIAPPPSAQPPVPARSPLRTRVIALAVLVVVVVAGSAFAAFWWRSHSAKDSYVSAVRRAMGPVVSGNQAISAAFASLPSQPGPAKAAVARALTAAQAAQATLADVSVPSGEQSFSANASAAIKSELAWLSTVGTVLAHPASPMAAQLSSLEVTTQSKLAAVAPQVAGASASLPPVTSLIAFAQHETAGAATRTSLNGFVGQVQSLLTQSQPAFQQINTLYTQLSNVASGGFTSLTVPQVESQLQSIISNRTSLAASARTLSAPTGRASTVRNDLVAAMDASLTDDQAINNCFNQYNTGTLAFISENCLSSTNSDSVAATNAKQTFSAAYNSLRASLGLPANRLTF